MKVKVIKPARLNGKGLVPGEIVELDNDLAAAWLAKGLAKANSGPGRPPKAKTTESRQDLGPAQMSKNKLVAMGKELGIDPKEFKGLSKEEIEHLTQILPQLGDEQTLELDEDNAARRQGTFATLAQFLPRVVDFRPLVLIIDDLQFADEATLILLRILIQTKKLTTFVCGSSLEFLKRSGEEEASPLERFYSRQHKELGIRRVQLRPLSQDDIAEYLKGVFPSLRTPDNFDADLAHITQGNPLFLGEIIRKPNSAKGVTFVEYPF